MLIGKRIKKLRKKQYMTLAQLSKKSGVQIATLSRIENEKMTGTLDSHMRIAKALGIEITELYQALPSSLNIREEENATDSPESFTYNDKASYEILATKILSKKMMPILLKIEPGGKTNPEQNSLGSEKFVFILEGEINVMIGENAYHLTPGRTLYFDASVKHHYENIGEDVAKLISVATPVTL